MGKYIYTGKFKDLEAKGFIKNIFNQYYYLPGLADPDEHLSIDIKTREVEYFENANYPFSSKSLLDIIKDDIKKEE